MTAATLLPSLAMIAAVAWAGLAAAQTTRPDRSFRPDPDQPAEGLKLENFYVHDPFVVAHEPSQTYYLYTSGGRRNPPDGVRRSGVYAYKSKDLKSWNGPHLVFEVPDGTWAKVDQATWAPEVHEWNGRWYLFVTLHNNDEVWQSPPDAWRDITRRGTVIAVADSPDGPFELMDKERPHTPWDFMALDGTLYVDPDGQPWMVYAHEWVQKIDGTFEAIKLSDDLSETVGEPIHLFKASDAPWLNEEIRPSTGHLQYVTDGCQLYRTADDQLIMLWSSYNRDGYVQTLARSESGTLEGPWTQLEPLVYQDSGHGMMFDTFDGKHTLLILHRPFSGPGVRSKVFEMKDTGDGFKVVRQRVDLDGDETPNSDENR